MDRSKTYGSRVCRIKILWNTLHRFYNIVDIAIEKSTRIKTII